MSQEKVDKYKQEKANREKIMKREKRILLLEKIAAGAVCLVIVGWIGYSVYGLATREDTDSANKTVIEMDATAINDYLSNLGAEE